MSTLARSRRFADDLSRLSFTLIGFWVVGCGGEATPSDAERPKTKPAANTTPTTPGAAAVPAVTARRDPSPATSPAEPATPAVKTASEPLAATKPKREEKSKVSAETTKHVVAKPLMEEKPKEETKAAAKAVEPTTTRDAVKVIDLRTLPKLNSDQALDESSTLSTYLSKSSLAGSLAYYNAEMAARGWKEEKGKTPDGKDYATRTYTKDGYSLGLSLGAGAENQISISLTNLGKVDMMTLPQPPDSRRLDVSTPTAASYHTDKDAVSTAEACKRALKDAGWLEYRDYSPENSAIKRWDSHFLKNSENVTFLVGDLPAGGPAKTYVGYYAAQVLPFDIPIPPDATDLKLDVRQREVNFKSPQEPEKLAAFYRARYEALGWEDRSRKENAPSEKTGGILVFDDRKEARFFVQIVKGDQKENGSKVAVRPLSRVEPKLASAGTSSTSEADRLKERKAIEAARRATDTKAQAKSKAISKAMRDEMNKAIKPDADQIKSQTGIDVSKLVSDALKDDDDEKSKGNEPSATPAGDSKGEKPRAAVAFISSESMPLPDGAKEISRNLGEKSISYKTSQAPDAQEEFFNAKLKPMGWETNSVARGSVNDDIHWTLGYGKDALGLEVDIRYNGTSRTGTTVISGDGLRFDPAGRGTPTPVPPPDRSLASQEVQGLPIPRENDGHSAEGSPFRKSVAARVKAPLDVLADFYRKKLTERGWKEAPAEPQVPADKNKLEMAFSGETGSLHVLLTAGDAGTTTIALNQRNDQEAQKAGIVPREGRARLMMGNGFNADAVIEINGKAYTLKAETGAKDPATAYKLDLFPGKNQVVIKVPGKEVQKEFVDCVAGEAWGLMIVDNGSALVLRLY